AAALNDRDHAAVLQHRAEQRVEVAIYHFYHRARLHGLGKRGVALRIGHQASRQAFARQTFTRVSRRQVDVDRHAGLPWLQRVSDALRPRAIPQTAKRRCPDRLKDIDEWLGFPERREAYACIA